MNEYSIKSIRKQFSENGVFYTDKAMAELMKSYMPDSLTEVYDPTCGCGNLLAVFADEVHKYGQELNAEQAKEAAALPNAHIVAGDTLKDPAFAGKKFRGIVANYPFSVKWEPDEADVRFSVAPCTAPPGRADWAFLLHIIHYLSEDGVAAVLCSPGIGFRGNREATIRQWVIGQGYIHECRLMEGGHFADTNIPTLMLIIRRAPAKKILFVDNESDRSVEVPVDEVLQKGAKLDPKYYLPAIATDKFKCLNPVNAEVERRHNFIKIMQSEIALSKMFCETSGLSVEPFIDSIIAEANKLRQQPSLFV